MMIKSINEYNIIVLAETQKGTRYDINFEGYQCKHFASSYRHNRAKRAPGGFLVLVKDTIYKDVKLCKQK